MKGWDEDWFHIGSIKMDLTPCFFWLFWHFSLGADSETTVVYSFFSNLLDFSTVGIALAPREQARSIHQMDMKRPCVRHLQKCCSQCLYKKFCATQLPQKWLFFLKANWSQVTNYPGYENNSHIKKSVLSQNLFSLIRASLSCYTRVFTVLRALLKSPCLHLPPPQECPAGLSVEIASESSADTCSAWWSQQQSKWCGLYSCSHRIGILWNKYYKL